MMVGPLRSADLQRDHPPRRPAGPATTPPAWATLSLLTDATAQAAHAVHIGIRPPGGITARTLTWGREPDTRPVSTTGDLTDSRVAAYVAKYATKAAESTGTLDRRICPANLIGELPIRDRGRRHIAECLRLAKYLDYGLMRPGVEVSSIR